VVVAVVFTLATLGSLGPHMVMLGYKLAGVRVPAAILLFCPLHHLSESGSHTWKLSAKPLTVPALTSTQASSS
jgi:hypothetical protein